MLTLFASTSKKSVNSRYPDTEALVYLKDKIGKSTPYAHTA